jgi:hypothetical protein
MEQTTKLASPRGSRKRMMSTTTGSSRNAIIDAMTIVMKNERP